MRDVAHLVDESASGRILVIGSLPPGGRDLDVLAWPDDRRSIAERLASEGFVARDGHWVRFAGGSAHVVDLAAAEAYGVPEDELRSAFEAGIPLEGMTRLVRPAPHHAVLILARLGVTPKRLPRLERALAEDPEALAKAEEAAPRWRADLRRLRPRTSPLAFLRRRRRLVIALSGVDGSGKSSQAHATEDALERLGYRARAVWMPIAANPAVWRVSAFGHWVVGRFRRRTASEGSFFATPGQEQRPRLLTRMWVAYIAVANTLTHRRLARRGEVTVFDRYVLDSVVRMRFMWGSRFPFAAWLVRALSPRPAAAFLLDVPAEVAYARKPEHWDEDALRRFRELYREEAERLGVTVLDGTLPPEELSAAIAEEAWRRLG